MKPALARVRKRPGEAPDRLRGGARELGGLLYKPSFASALSLNACYDPGVARTLDQCGTI